MPLIINDYKWKQSDSVVTIQVPLHGVHQSKVDLFTSPNYIKASFERYFFEVFLLHGIKVSESKCTKTPCEIIFELAKCEELQWDNLEIDLPKKDKQALKQKLIEEENLRFQEECQKKFERRSELKKVAVREQINLDTKYRTKIEQIKTEEKTKALGDIQEWQKQSRPKIVEIVSDDEKEEPVIPILTPKKRNKIGKSTLVPFPRKSTTMHVDFTNRQFPTPCRESQLPEEEEWLRKQAEVRRSVGFMSEDLRPEEKNPQYLNSKGQEFLKSGNYLGAISAFSFGIKLCDQFPDLFIGRSEAHFNKENFYKCAQDCSSALDLLRPAVPSNLDQRVTCISRRGMALRKLCYLKESINELEVAVKLCPSDQVLRNVLNEVKCEYANYENKDRK